MTVQFSLAHLTVLGTTPLDLIQIAADAGYDYASIRMTPVADGEHVTPLAGDPDMVRRVSKRLTDSGVQVLDVELARLGPDDEPETYLGVLEAAAAIGARHVLAQLNDPDLHRATERFGRLCDLAVDVGLTVDLEFPSWSETGDLPAAVAVVRAVNRSNAGILIDTLHFFRSNSSIDELAALPPEWFRFVQLCDAPADAPATVEGVIHTARVQRVRCRGTATYRSASCSHTSQPGPIRWRFRTTYCGTNWGRPNTPAWSWRPLATSSPTTGSQR